MKQRAGIGSMGAVRWWPAEHRSLAEFVMPAFASFLMVCVPVIGHAQSALDGFNPGANGVIIAIAVQADGKILVGGTFTTLGGGGTGTTPRNHIGRLNADGTIDASFNPGADSDISAIAVQPDGKIVVGGYFTTLGGGGTTPRHCIGRLNANGDLDTSFDPGANYDVRAIALRPEGKILVGGGFTTLGGGGTGTTPRDNIGRLYADGSIDTSFNPGLTDATVMDLKVQADGKILVGGFFEVLGGTTRHHLGRLNADGSLDTSFNPGLNPGINHWVDAIGLQADGKILVGGVFTALGGGTGTTPRDNIGRLYADGSVDTSFNPGSDGDVQELAIQPDGKILVGGDFSALGGGTGTTPRSRIGRLYADGSVDTDFNPGSDGDVRALAIRPDGKILIGGDFNQLGGGGIGAIPRNYIGRLNADGSLDGSFDAGANNTVMALAVQPDGKILVGGVFTTLGGGGSGLATRNYIGRLNADGTIDESFDPGADADIYAIAVQPDGKIVVGGYFNFLGGAARKYIGRLNADGSLDTSFDPGANHEVSAIALQPDGKIVVGGYFTTLGGGGFGTTSCNRICRLNADGSLDTSFDAGANAPVLALAMQPDGKILAGGLFSTLGGGATGKITRNRIGRVNADGGYDSTFNPGANHDVTALALQADGKIVVGGDFTRLGGGGTGITFRNRIGRLHADGSIDESFDPGADDYVWVLAIQSDGRILVGGYFITLGGGGTGTASRYFIGRLTNPDVPTQNITVDRNGTTVTWERSGSCPEIDGATFELSTDGIIYTPLGSAARVSGGWQLTGLILPREQYIFIRARSAYLSSFRSIMESVRAVYLPREIPPVIDFDGDGKADITVFRPDSGVWYKLLSGSPGHYAATQWGLSTDTPVAGDYDGDGITDIAVWRPSSGVWYILFSGTPGTYVSRQWGLSTDIPVPADYDGDEKADIAAWRAETGTWYILPSGSPGTYTSIQLGATGDIAVPADYDGDGKTDTAVWSQTTGIWSIRSSGSAGTVTSTQWGLSGDKPVPADYDGDGKIDIAIWRPSDGIWYILGSNSPGTYTAMQWGLSTDIPVPGDYDGDAKVDMAVWRPDSGVWYILPSGSPGSYIAMQWGLATDVPISSITGILNAIP